MSLLSSGLLAQFIPSPEQGVWHLGPVPIRAYALAIILGVIASIWLGERRWIARGGRAGQVGDVALWAVPAGLIGARVYHVITDNGLYFGDGENPWEAFAIWHGGLGIWGAIAGGAVGAWFACRLYGIKLLPFMDALAPALLLAQAIGRWGNYFNQELFGKPTDKPWGLEISRAKVDDLEGTFKTPEFLANPPYTFHPTFLYECLWNLGAMGLLIYLDRRFKLGFGRVFALYVMAYCAGRAWIENLRIDTVEYDDVLGLRLNVWTSIVLFAAALAYFVIAGRKHPAPDTREDVVLTGPGEITADLAAEGTDQDETDAVPAGEGEPAVKDPSREIE